jgi:hypothetical protein
LPRRFFRERNLVGCCLGRGGGLSAERVTQATRARSASLPVSCLMSIMPLFEFVLVMIGIGTFAILLTALVLTATARLH